ncbi:CHRD domain-containing protein [Novosphingobium pentaromativorans]|uniref:CHRD domain-containing protein n=1 Tax=Novosphingobium pentaromativorans US6-1 TaxID=1088721 RepID=G6EAR9_9SPHN|nr:CHRD domain-containing protein [Novosphingobium pentaromativorans]AIT80586.1 hypothetical protein JI59_12815 [Novosphingobium pentaromativorans US6-1]EHJ61706.1 hypothetical protein NSU_1467 [Novosphingobium pentaromativorans US6-1]
MPPATSRLATALSILALAAVSSAASAAEAADHTYKATLSGEQETKGGDPDGTGTVTVTVSSGLDKLCYDVGGIENLSPITAAHIHKAAAGQDGPPVLTLEAAEDGGFKGCVKGPEWLPDAVASGFAGYYVNVHTGDYPAGAIRAQLGS